ncbi:hypothetical protein GCM10009613_05400 [Pseudonocardia kongjuensis]|uniref:FAD dependent oxidoreductase domain-containing protein n=1 Tax=Pseudonocardia kongjuensis TaxID=102227 RepID=A0ABN1XGE1_9PSEU
MVAVGTRTGADAVVIGAGVIGSAIALELARAGRRVTVVDRAGGPGEGSTSASSAIVRYNFSTLAGVATQISPGARHRRQARQVRGVPPL